MLSVVLFPLACTHKKSVQTTGDWFTRFILWFRQGLGLRLRLWPWLWLCCYSIAARLYFLYQAGDFLVGDAVAVGLVVDGEEGDDPFFDTDDGRVGDDPCAVAFAPALVAEGHAHLAHSVAEVGACRGVLFEPAKKFLKVFLQ